MYRLFVELIVNNFGLVALGQAELLGRDKREHQPLHVAVRTITFNNLLKVSINLKSVLSAVAPSCVGFHEPRLARA